MRLTLSCIILLVFAVSPAYPEDLKKLNLDDASAIGTIIQADTKIKAEGKGSIRITTQGSATICLGQVR